MALCVSFGQDLGRSMGGSNQRAIRLAGKQHPNILMRKFNSKLVKFLLIGLPLMLALSGCAAALSALGTLGSGVAGGADYLVSTPVAKTVSYDYDRMKKALLVTLCKMVIAVEKVQEIENGEKIFAEADDLIVVIELRKITASLTRIEIRAGEGVVKRDTATAEAIVQKTTELGRERL